MSFGSSTVPIRVCVRATKLYLLITAPLSLLIALLRPTPLSLLPPRPSCLHLLIKPLKDRRQ